jgi:hypothetical protein
MVHSRSWGITLVAILMIVFGLAEIATSFTHNFLGLISTTDTALATYGAAGVGALYAMGGVLLLTMKKQAAKIAMACLTLVVAGRAALVLTGLYPLTSFLQVFSIIIGTTIAVLFGVYIGLKCTHKSIVRNRKPAALYRLCRFVMWPTHRAANRLFGNIRFYPRPRRTILLAFRLLAWSAWRGRRGFMLLGG